MIAVEYKIEIVHCIFLCSWKYIYRLTAAVTDIVTNSTAGTGTVQLLSGTKCKIISTGHEGLWESGFVAPLFKLERSYSLAQSIAGQTQTGTG